MNKKIETNFLVITVVMLLAVLFGDIKNIVNDDNNTNKFLSYKEENNIENILQKPVNKHDNIIDNNSINDANTRTKEFANKNTNTIESNIMGLKNLEFDINSGIIAYNTDSEADDISDNTFTFYVDKAELEKENHYLQLEIKGLKNIHNTNLSLNGNIISKGEYRTENTEWNKDAIRLENKHLKQGLNHLIFSSSSSKYFVKNINITNENKKNYNLSLHHNILIVNNINNEKEIIINGKTIELQDNKFLYEIQDNEKTFEIEYRDETKTVHIDQIDEVKEYFAENELIESLNFEINNTIKNTFQLNNFTTEITNKEATGSVKLLELQGDQIPNINLEIVNTTKNKNSYRVNSNTKLDQHIRLAYDKSSIPDGYDEKDIRIFYFDKNEKSWKTIEIDSINIEQSWVSARFDEASTSESKAEGDKGGKDQKSSTDFINGILKTPESPESNGFTPTSISDIKAANPNVGIIPISAPQPSNMGSAGTSFQLKLPQGRAGMQAQVAISYNTSGGLAWCGNNWDVSQSTISVETTWGVPIYDNSNESESYRVDGELLMPYFHRETTKYPRQADKEFFPKKESGAYNKITRKGTNPTNYYWIIESKNGSKTYYGGTPSQGIIPNAVYNTSSGAIAEWKLVMTEDLNGNNVKYYYDKYNDGIYGTNNGQQIILNHIAYTGHNNQDGKYSVEFISENNTLESRTNMKYGLKQVNSKLLKKVLVKYENQIIRQYELEYQAGAFYKTLLKSIIEQDANGNEFYRNTMEYYNDITQSDGSVKFFEDVETIDTKEDNLLAAFTGIDGFNNRHTAIGGANSQTISMNGSVGVGFDKKIDSGRTNTIGLDFGGSIGESTTKISLMDIDGDNLPDKVIYDQDFISYYRKSKFENGKIVFGQATLLNLPNIGLSLNNSFNIGVSGRFKFVSAGYNWQFSTTKTKSQLIDLNGDGIIDYISNKGTKYGKLNSNGILEFVDNSSSTFFPILASEEIQNNTNINSEVKKKIENSTPLHDVCRIWIAQRDGTINISSSAKLIQDTTTERLEYVKNDDSDKADGVKIAMYKKGTLISPIVNINSNDYTSHTMNSNLNVKAGDKIYFRVNSKYDGNYDKVEWNPTIKYISNMLYSNTMNDNINEFEASNDFVNSFNSFVTINSNNISQNKIKLNKDIMNEDIYIKLYKYDFDNNTSQLISILDTLKADTILNNYEINYTYNNNNVNSANISVVFESNARIKWEKLDIIESKIIVDQDTNLLPYKLKIYNKKTGNGNYIFDKKANTYTTDFNILKKDTNVNLIPCNLINLNGKNIKLQINAYQNNKLHRVKTAIVNDTILYTYDSTYIPFDTNVPIIIEVIADSNKEIFSSIEECYELQYLYRDSNDSLISTKIEKLDRYYYNEFTKFGLVYRGWGGIALNGNEVSMNGFDENTIFNDNTTNNDDEDKPPFGDFDNKDDAEDFEPSDDDDGGYSTNSILYYVLHNLNEESWQSSDADSYVDPQYIVSSRMPENDIWEYLESAKTVFGDRDVILSKTKGKSRSGNASISIGPIGVGGTISNNGETYTKEFMMDLNGDRFPDIIKEAKVQFTAPTGGISNNNSTIEAKHNQSLSNSRGINRNGNYTHTDKKKTPAINNQQNENKCNDNKEDKVNQTETVANDEKNYYSLGITGSFNTSEEWGEYTYTDINGDGLQDIIKKSGNVSFNYGYSFGNNEQLGFVDFSKSNSETIGAGLGFSKKKGSWSGGLNYSSTNTYIEKNMTDINGDGLIDFYSISDTEIIFDISNGKSSFNTNNIYNPLATNKGSLSTSFGGNGSFSFGFPIFSFRLNITVGAGVSNGHSKTTFSFMDINGDGYTDLVSSEANNELKVRYNRMGRTNMLKKINTPNGTFVELDYQRINPTQANPNSMLVLSEVKTYDTIANDGIHTSIVQYEYQNPKYDRYEREFLGFGKFITKVIDPQNNEVYKKSTQEYYNDNVYTKGLVKKTYTSDKDNNLYTRQSSTYTIRNARTNQPLTMANLDDKYINKSVIILPTSTIAEDLNGGNQVKMSTKEEYIYDNRANIIYYKNYGNGISSDTLSAVITYHQNTTPYIDGIPKKITVYTKDGLVRKRESIIDYNTGQLKELRQYKNATDYIKTNFEYDQYGNMTKTIAPKNYKGQRYWVSVKMDEHTHTLPIEIDNTFGYKSSTKYNIERQLPTEMTDINKEQMIYQYDNFDRQISVTGPYEIESGRPYTIKFEYFPFAPKAYATTYHWNEDYQSNIMTYTFMDQQGRASQVKKSITVYDTINNIEEEKILVSGRVIYDKWGRPIEQYGPIVELKGAEHIYNSTFDIIPPTRTEYDFLDRVIKQILPDSSEVLTKYEYTTHNGIQVLKNTMIDPLGAISYSISDVYGRAYQSVRKSQSHGDIITNYEYSPLGELLKVIDPLSNESTSQYDILGRRTHYTHADAGTIIIDYDDASNMISKSTSNLRHKLGENAKVRYIYNHNRLEQILYPLNPQNNVHYYYGDSTASHNRIGRLWLKEDASGGEEYFYGKMGVVEKNIRTVVVNINNIYTFVTKNEFDTWNRVKRMEYADGEELVYQYNRTGNLQAMYGTKDRIRTDYIKQIGYNKYEKISFKKYGNNTETRYTYDPIKQQLDRMTVHNTIRKIIDNRYTYDKVGNVLSISNKPELTNVNDLGGNTTQNYQYDDLYRLVSSTGQYHGYQKQTTADFSLNMQYDAMGKILNKRIVHRKNEINPLETNYTLSYTYNNNNKPNALQSTITNDNNGIHTTQYQYDQNGNMTMVQNTESYRQIIWDEENRITGINDQGQINLYTYDDQGERIVKSYGNSQTISIDGKPIGSHQHYDNFVAYINPQLVFEKGKFTKHYYSGSERIATKIGIGKWNNNYATNGGLTAGNIDFIARENRLRGAILQSYHQLQIPPGPPHMKGVYDTLVYDFQQEMQDNFNNVPPGGWNITPIFNGPGEPPGPPVQFGDTITTDNAEPGFGYENIMPVRELEIYYYHPDHLGSVSMISDLNGTVSQYIEYIPFGEEMYSAHRNTYNSPYRYTAKELDEETGLYYYGARYYNPKLSIWLSVDPMVEEAPNWTPYRFCFNNPIRYTDPTGLLEGDYHKKDGSYLGNDKKNDKKVYTADGTEEVDELDAKGNPTGNCKTKYINAKELSITYSEFINKASTVYGESSAYKMSSMTEDLKHEMYAIASVHERNNKAYGINSAKAKEFRALSKEGRSADIFKRTATAAVINALTGGKDYSNGATMWDGAEQSLFPATDNRSSTGQFELHMNTMGWNISDIHYKTWKSNIGSNFKAPQVKAAPENYGAYKNKGKTRLHSTAVYGQTIFWKIK